MNTVPMATNTKLVRKIACLQKSDSITGSFDVVHEKGIINVSITGSKIDGAKQVSYQTFLSMTLQFNFNEVTNYHFEILNKNGFTVFSFYGLTNNYRQVCANSFCNLTVVEDQNSDIVSTYLNDSSVYPNHIKIAVSFWCKPTALSTPFPENVDDNVTKLTPLESLKALLDEEAFLEIEAQKIAAVRESSVEVLKSVLNVSNAAAILQLAQKYDEEHLQQTTINFIMANLQEVLDSDGWKAIPEAMTKKLLSTVMLSLGPKKSKLESTD